MITRIAKSDYTDSEGLENKAKINEKTECTLVHEYFELIFNAVI